MLEIKPLIHTRLAAIPTEGPFQVDLLVRIQAPDAPESPTAPKPPLHLAVVLDRSGSMSGEPLRQACRCAAAILDRMGPQDRLALVAYDNRARVIRHCLPINNKQEAQQSLATLHSGGTTNLHLGWETGVNELKKVHEAGVISRVLLLSDGQANEGLVDPNELSEACGKAQASGISTSTYGLGPEFGEGVMTAMARHGQGRAYYGESAEDLMDPFMEEFDLLANLVARNLTVELQTLPGVRVTQRNGYLSCGDGAWKLPDLPYLGEAWVMFRIEGHASTLTPWVSDGLITLGRVNIRWQDDKAQEIEAPTLELKLHLATSTEYSNLVEDPLVAKRLGELTAADLQEQAHHAARMGDWDRVRMFLDELKKISKDNPWTQSVVAELETLMEEGSREVLAKELLMCSSAATIRIAEKDEGISFDLPTSSYLRRKRRQGSQRNSDNSI